MSSSQSVLTPEIKFKVAFDERKNAECQYLLDEISTDREKAYFLHRALAPRAAISHDRNISKILFDVVSESVKNVNQGISWHQFFYELVRCSNLVSNYELSTIILADLLKETPQVPAFLGDFLTATIKDVHEHFVAALEIYLNKAVDPETTAAFIPISVFLKSLFPEQENASIGQKFLLHDHISKIRDSPHCIAFLTALQGAGILDHLLSDPESPQTLTLFAGRKRAQKFLYQKKFGSKLEAIAVSTAEIFTWLGLAAAIAVGASVAIKSGASGTIDGWMLGSGIAYAVSQVALGLVSCIVQSRLLPFMVSSLSLIGAGLLYLHMTLPNALSWTELGVKVVAPLVICSDQAHSFLLSRDSFTWKFPGLPTWLSSKLEPLRPAIVYARLFCLPVLWPILTFLVSALTIVLVWTGHLKSAANCGCN